MAPTKATSSRGVLMRRISGKRPAAVLCSSGSDGSD
jgi:hypothetical protein